MIDLETIDLSQFFPWTWILHLVRALISFNIIHSVLKDKYNSLVTFFSVTVTCMLYSFFSLNLLSRYSVPPWLEVAAAFFYYAVQLVVILIVCEGKLFSKIFSVVFGFLTYTCSTIIFEFFRNLLTSSDYIVISQTTLTVVDFASCGSTSFAFSFLFAALIRRLKPKENQLLQYKPKFTFFLLFPFTHAFSSLISAMVLRANPMVIKDNYISKFVIVSLLVCMLLDFLIIFVVDHIEKLETENIEKERQLIKNAFDFQQTMMLKKEKQEFRKIKHDLSNIINTARGFIEIGKPEKALAILKSTNDDLEGLAGFSVCSDETVNTILFIKLQQAESLGIKLIAEIDENCPIQIDDYDLCRLLNNIIDNEINAVNALSKNRTCRVSVSIDEENIVIKSENGYNSKNQNKSKKSDGHGNGIEIICEIANKYDGEYSSTQTDSQYFTKTVLKNTIKNSSTPPPAKFLKMKKSLLHKPL